MRVALSALAELDWQSTGRYGGARWGAERARRYAAQLRTALHLIGEHPYSGSPHVARTGHVTGYRRESIGSHVIFYKVTDAGVEIGRILHASQDAERHLS